MMRVGSGINATTEDGTPYRILGGGGRRTTDSNGDCTFSGLVGQLYNFNASTSDGRDASGSGSPTVDGNIVTIQLPAITTFTLSGVLTDSSGNPVAGADVSANSTTTGAGASTTSGDDGSYSLELVPDTYSVDFDASVDGIGETVSIGSLSISSDLVENVSYAPVGTVTTTVEDANGNPVPGASVSMMRVGSGINATTEDGTPYRILGGGGRCRTTDSNGDCTFSGLVGQLYNFNASTSDGRDASGSGSPTVDGNIVTIQLPAITTFTLSGVLTDSSGNPVAGADVSANSTTTGAGASTTSGDDGSYSLELVPDTYSVDFDASVDGIGETVSIGSLSISSDLVENVSYAPVGTVTTTVEDANGNPVPGASVSMMRVGSGINATTEDGTPYRILGGGGRCRTTDSNGDCTFSGLVGVLYDFNITPPGGLAESGMGSPTAEGTTVMIQLEDYVTVQSAGSTPGTISISSPAGTQLADVSDTVATTNGLPAGSVAVTGALSYEVDVAPGSSASVMLTLPSGSDPTDVFKYQNGAYVNVTSLATISGDTITLTLTDGGLGDADGAVNGVIVDPLVPVRITPQAQSVAFSSVAPHAATVGAHYTPSATSSSGLPVAITLDNSSTGCALTNGVVAFTGVGTCIVDANQSGNTSYNAATQVQQSITVTKASQKVTFQSTLPEAAVGATYRPAAIASSGLSAVIGLDSTSKGCALKSGLVSFTAPGTCVLDANQSGNADYSVAPEAQQRISVVEILVATSGLAAGKVGVKYSATLKASGGNPPYTWSLATGSKPLPVGLKLSSAGVISGKPTKKGTYSFTVKVADTKTKTKPVTQHSATRILMIVIS